MEVEPRFLPKSEDVIDAEHLETRAVVSGSGGGEEKEVLNDGECYSCLSESI